MKPATRSKKRAIIAATLVGAFSFYWYFDPFPWLGVLMGVLFGLLVYFALTTRRMELVRRGIFIGFFIFVLVAVLAIIFDMGTDTFLSWVEVHEPEYYLPGQTLGANNFPYTRIVPQAIFGGAEYNEEVGTWEAVFPSSLGEILFYMVPFFLTGIIFGRSFCGWICPFGGLGEGFVTGRKERWKMKIFTKQVATKSGLRYEGLRDWVKDAKYGILLAVILLSIIFAFPLICIFCPVLWLKYMVFFWLIIITFVIFLIFLPFMTKRRWWCLICPVGAALILLHKVSFFRIRINKRSCIKCLDCVQDCRSYAVTPDTVEKLGRPNADCVRCGRCIETCPEDAVDLYWFGTSKKARSWFITLAILAVSAWGVWFAVTLTDITRHLL